MEDDSEDEALDIYDEIMEAIEELPAHARKRGGDFFVDVVEKANGIKKDVDFRGVATAGQLRALRNMLEGVKKWQK